MIEEEANRLDRLAAYDFNGIKMINGIKMLCAQAAVDAIKAFGCEPDTYAWRCWWETQRQ